LKKISNLYLLEILHIVGSKEHSNKTVLESDLQLKMNGKKWNWKIKREIKR